MTGDPNKKCKLSSVAYLQIPTRETYIEASISVIHSNARLFMRNNSNNNCPFSLTGIYVTSLLYMLGRNNNELRGLYSSTTFTPRKEIQNK